MENYQIHKTALKSDYEHALKLIESNIDLDELDANGHTALHWAVFRGDIDFVKLLLEAGANPNIFSRDGVTPKWRARDFGLTEIDTLLDNVGGKILTNENFDKVSFSIFNNAIGQPLPIEEGISNINTQRKKWWKFW